MNTMIAIANPYGNVDVRLPFPKSYTHVPGPRLPQLCRKLGIRFARALTGFVGKERYGFNPQFDGVVVSSRSAEKLRQAIAAREQRNSGPAAEIRKRKAAEYRRRKQQAERETISALGVDPDGFTARRLRRGYIDEDHARLLGFIAAHRHIHTDYEEQLVEARNMGLRGREVKEYARDAMTGTVFPQTWEDYLRTYGFDSPEAKVMASVLKDPTESHPVWFKEAELAVRRAGLDLSSLTYEMIADAIADWRRERE